MIGQALADHTKQRSAAALPIVAAVRFAVVVPELELREISVQVLLGAMLLDALHAALENRKAALDRVRVNTATDILAGLMVHLAVAEEPAVQHITRIDRSFVG